MSEAAIQGLSHRYFSPVPGATVSLDTTKYINFKWTPGEDETINAASAGFEDQELTIIIDTSGATSRTLTFGTNFRSTATLATGTTTARRFVVTFVSDGLVWTERCRTAAQA